MARALAVAPSILLLDEPFAALDKNLRLDMQIEIKRIQRVAGTTTIIVTHDQEEALSMADRVAVLNHGRLEQFAASTDVYDNPQSFFVNTFVGSSNILEGEITALNGTNAQIQFAGGASMVGQLIGQATVGGAARVCIRPEHLAFSQAKEALSGTIEMGLPLGSSIIHEVRLHGGSAVKIAGAREAGALALAPGTPVGLVPAHPGAVRIYAGN